MASYHYFSTKSLEKLGIRTHGACLRNTVTQFKNANNSDLDEKIM